MSELTIIDGGMGGELIARGIMASEGLWSAQALVDQPDVVKAVHRDFVDAGAKVIITNSYSTIPSYLEKAGIADKYREYAEIAGQIAREVADQAGGVSVAGSLPPLDESYRHDLVPEDNVAIPIYEGLVEALAPYVDLFVCETMSCIRESLNATKAASKSGKPVWVAWTLHETPGQGLRSGESVTEAFEQLEAIDPAAYIFNCSTPESIESALADLTALTDKPVGVYPNLLRIPDGWTLDNDVQTGRREMSVEEFVDFSKVWRSQGASILGGCCGIGPSYIRALQEQVT